jgi:hypothetical protein
MHLTQDGKSGLIRAPDRKGAQVNESYPAPASPDEQAALAQLAELIANPETRKEFSVDARAALEKAGVKSEQLPGELIERFGRLSADELTIFAEHGEALKKHGFYVEFPNSVARLWLF